MISYPGPLPQPKNYNSTTPGTNCPSASDCHRPARYQVLILILPLSYLVARRKFQQTLSYLSAVCLQHPSFVSEEQHICPTTSQVLVNGQEIHNGLITDIQLMFLACRIHIADNNFDSVWTWFVWICCVFRTNHLVGHNLAPASVTALVLFTHFEMDRGRVC